MQCGALESLVTVSICYFPVLSSELDLQRSWQDHFHILIRLQSKVFQVESSKILQDAVEVARAVVIERLIPELPNGKSFLPHFQRSQNDFATDVPAELRAIITPCYSYEADKRPTFEELVDKLSTLK